MWTLEEGLGFVRQIQDASRLFGYHVTLGGGVLNTGSSEHDLDVYMLPMGGFNIDKTKSDPKAMIKWMEKFLGAATPLGKEYSGTKPVYATTCKFIVNDKRIDCFFF